MKKLSFLMVFFLIGSYSPRADEGPGGDPEFIQQLDNIKDPFDDGLPTPVVIAPKPIDHPQQPKPIPRPRPKPVPVPVKLPDLKLQGVLVGEDMHEAIINDQVVPLMGFIQGAQVHSVSKQGVELLYKGKKFFLKVD